MERSKVYEQEHFINSFVEKDAWHGLAGRKRERRSRVGDFINN